MNVDELIEIIESETDPDTLRELDRLRREMLPECIAALNSIATDLRVPYIFRDEAAEVLAALKQRQGWLI